jgi:tagatose-1,6-bisphosphate aldolase
VEARGVRGVSGVLLGRAVWEEAVEGVGDEDRDRDDEPVEIVSVTASRCSGMDASVAEAMLFRYAAASSSLSSCKKFEYWDGMMGLS